jgi:hypothetical protein
MTTIAATTNKTGMLKTLLGAFLGAKVEERSGHPITGAVVGAAAVSLARRSLPLAIGLALGVAAMELASRYQARRRSPRALRP